MNRLSALVAALSPLLGACPIDPYFELTQVDDDAIDGAVYEKMIEQRMVGFRLAVVLDGRPFYAHGYDFENWDLGVRVYPTATLFFAGPPSRRPSPARCPRWPLGSTPRLSPQ